MSDIPSSTTARKLKEMETRIGVLDARLSAVEHTLPKMAQAIKETFSQIGDEVARLTAVEDAVTQVIGQDKVQAKMDEISMKQQADFAMNAKANMAKLLANGDAEEISEVTPNCTVVGVSEDAEGNTLPPGYVQFPMAQSPDWAKELLGKGPGAKIPLPDGTFLIVQQIVRATQKSPTAPETTSAEATPQEQPADPAAAPEVTAEVGGQGG